MKRFLSCISIALCAAVCAVFLTACGSPTQWLTPNVVFDGDELTVEFATNMEKDFVLPVEGQTLDHSRFVDERVVQYCWALYNSKHELVGWVEAGNGYDINKKNELIYGYGTGYNNDEYGYFTHLVCVTLKTTDLDVFDNLELSTDCGTIKKTAELDKNPMRGTDRFAVDDPTTPGQLKPAAGGEKVVCCLYTLDLSSVDPNGPRTMTITLSAKS